MIQETEMDRDEQEGDLLGDLLQSDTNTVAVLEALMKSIELSEN
jgi:hypothetical protein